jgi:hypothetical protein
MRILQVQGEDIFKVTNQQNWISHFIYNLITVYTTYEFHSNSLSSSFYRCEFTDSHVGEYEYDRLLVYGAVYSDWST